MALTLTPGRGKWTRARPSDRARRQERERERERERIRLTNCGGNGWMGRQSGKEVKTLWEAGKIDMRTKREVARIEVQRAGWRVWRGQGREESKTT